MTNAIRCNHCDSVFLDENELELGEDEDGFFQGCPHCHTDADLMDIEEDEKTLRKALIAHAMAISPHTSEQ